MNEKEFYILFSSKNIILLDIFFKLLQVILRLKTDSSFISIFLNL